MHVLNRMAFGPSAEDVARVIRLGVERYIEEQLHPERVPLPQAQTEHLASLPIMKKAPGELSVELRQLERAANQNPEGERDRLRQFVAQVIEQTADARLSRAIGSPRQLEEVMVDFWFNHLNVFQGKGLDRVMVARYEQEAIRPHVLGRFRDLLGATARHPAMLFYLDNWLSTAPGFQPFLPVQGSPRTSGLNENYARELMELHTLGVDGGYTQRDVTELARILTGWTFDPRTESFQFVARRHDSGDKDWLGRHVGSSGQSEGEFALDVLAGAPATARHIAYQLAQYFVSDQPPQALVDRLANRFIRSQGDIRSVLDALFHSPEFWDPANYGTKFKTPYRYVVSAVRASGVHVVNFRPMLGALRQLGQPLYECQTPDGYKNTEEAWLNSNAMALRLTFATAFAAGRLPLMAPPESGQNGREAPGNSLRPAVLTTPQAAAVTPLDAQDLSRTLGVILSGRTREAIDESNPNLRAALMLGSPEFMRH
jgi:uncharacterized protein (DUF1800 family)